MTTVKAAHTSVSLQGARQTVTVTLYSTVTGTQTVTVTLYSTVAGTQTVTVTLYSTVAGTQTDCDSDTVQHSSRHSDRL